MRHLVLAAALLGTVLALLPAARAGGRERRDARLSPKERARVELGRRLFFDPVVSRSGARACSSCHDPEHGYSDRAARSLDDVGLTRRHSQTLLDSTDNPSAHWDGEFESLESLVTARLKPVSHGKGLASHGASLSDAVASGTGTEPAKPKVEEPPPPEPTGGGDDDSYGGDSGGADRGDTEPSKPTDPREAEPADAPADAPAEAPADAPDPACPCPVTQGNGGPPPAARAPEGEKPADGSKAPGAPGAPPAPPAPPAPVPSDAPDPHAPPPASDPFAPSDGSDLPLDVRRLPRVDVTLEHASRYREAFQAAYGSPDVNIDRIAGAIAAYCRTLTSGTNAYDRHVAGDAAALTPLQQRGLALFQGKAGCATCHSLVPGPDGRAPFTDYGYHDTGIAFREFGSGLPEHTRRGMRTEADRGREAVSTRPQDRHAFKTPSLRDVARRGPFFHDGSASTLEEVVRYYAAGGSDDPEKSAHVKPFPADDADVAALVAFLRALSGDVRPGLAREAWKARAPRTTLTFLDGVGRRMAGLVVRIEPAGDVLAGAAPAAETLTLTADARGEVAFAMPLRTHVRVVLPDGLAPRGGDLVPDTCASARIEVPVDGRVRLVLEAPAARVLPDVLAAEHTGLMRLPGHPAPRTLLTKVGAVPAGPDRVVALYAGWRRTDVPETARLLVPVAKRKPPQRVAVVLAGEGVVALPSP